MNILNIIVLFLTPLFSFVGSYIAPRKTAKEQDVWRKREETYKNLRWAVDKTESNDKKTRKNGFLMLKLLLRSELLQREDIEMVHQFTGSEKE